MPLRLRRPARIACPCLPCTCTSTTSPRCDRHGASSLKHCLNLLSKRSSLVSFTLPTFWIEHNNVLQGGRSLPLRTALFGLSHCAGVPLEAATPIELPSKRINELPNLGIGTTCLNQVPAFSSACTSNGVKADASSKQNLLNKG